MCFSTPTYTIPEKEINIEKIYVGTGIGFSNPAEVDYQKITEATPEYKEIIENKIEVGTGKYWILLNEASNKAIKTIQTFAVNNNYDLITSLGYLGSLVTPISSINITKLVVNSITESTE